MASKKVKTVGDLFRMWLNMLSVVYRLKSFLSQNPCLHLMRYRVSKYKKASLRGAIVLLIPISVAVISKLSKSGTNDLF